MRRLVYDVGMHRGEDTEFYLRRGFDVIGIEANPQLVEMLREKFRSEIRTGRVTIIGKAIATDSGQARFITSSVSAWGTTSQAFADRNARSGADCYEIEVECISFADIVREFGLPYYLKIDIEGADLLCLDALIEFPQRPRFVSIESSATAPGCGFLEALRELQMPRALGYRKFKYVDQALIPGWHGHLIGEGKPLCYVFPEDSSGPFGNDLVRPWRSYTTATVIGLVLKCVDDLCGHSGRLYGKSGTQWLRDLRNRLTGRPDHWYDLHAALD